MVHYRKIIASCVALSFFWLTVLAPFADAVSSDKLATPTIWKPAAHQDRAMIKQAELELLMGLTALYTDKGTNLADVNEGLAKFDSERKRVLKESGLGELADLWSAIQFKETSWDEAAGILTAVFVFTNRPQDVFRVAYNGNKEEMKFERGYLPLQAVEEERLEKEVSGMSLSGESSARQLFDVLSRYPEAQKDDVLVVLANELLEMRSKNPALTPVLREFFKGAIVEARRISAQYAEDARNLAVIAGSSLVMLSWMDQNVVGASNIRLTNDPQFMVKSPLKEYGKSFIDIRTVTTVPQSAAEGKAGIYYRGTEGVSKMGKIGEDKDLAQNAAIFDFAGFAAAREATILYIMIHGFLPVPEELKAMTEEGLVTPIHETMFLTDILPGSVQFASTGPGHFQGMLLDIKYVTEGTGIQYNKIYDANGNLIKVFAQYLKRGTWAIAIPGAVESIENLGGLKFNDFSVKVSVDVARKLNPLVNFDDLEAIRKAAEAASKVVLPSFAVKRLDTGIVSLVPASDEVSNRFAWVNPVPQQIFGAMPMFAFYNSVSEEKLNAVVDNVAKFTSSNAWVSIEVTIQMAESVDKDYVELMNMANSPEPVINNNPNDYVLQKYAWGGLGIPRLLNITPKPGEPENIAEVWFNSTNNDGLSKVPGTQITLQKLIETNPEAVLGPGMAEKPVFSKFLGKKENQPQIVHLGFNEKIEAVGKKAFTERVLDERAFMKVLQERLAAYHPTKEQFSEYQNAYNEWVIKEINERWTIPETPKLPEFMKGFNTDIFDRIRQNRANIVSVLNEIQLTEGQMIISPVGYLHSIVGSHQTHPPSTSTEAKNEAWYIFAAAPGSYLYFEPQQTSNTTYSPFDFAEPIVWKGGNVQMRKDLTKGLNELLAEGEAAPKSEAVAIKLIIDRSIKFEASKPEDFVVNDQIKNVSDSYLYANPVNAQVDSLIEGTYAVWPKELFTLHRIALKGKAAQPASVTVNPVPDLYHELIVLKGTVGVTIDGQKQTLMPGASIFVPAKYETPYTLTASEDAEVMRLIPAVPAQAAAMREEMPWNELEPLVRDEVRELDNTIKATVKQANPKDGVVIIAIDDKLFGRFNWAVSAITSIMKLINNANPDAVILVKDSGDGLIGKIREAVDSVKAKGLSVRKIVTQVNAQTSAEVRDTVADMENSVVLNINLEGKSLAKNYLQTVRLCDLCLKIAYNRVDDIQAALSKILGRPISASYVLSLLARKIWDLLPALTPVKESTAIQAYKMVRQTVSSL